MNKSDIKKIYYNGNEITSLHWGGNLLYQKENDMSQYMIKGVWENAPYSSYNQYNGKPYLIFNKNRIDNLPINSKYKFGYNADEILTDASYMFANATFKSSSSMTTDYNYNLTSVDISDVDFSMITKADGMFYKCKKLTEINGLNSLSSAKLTTASYMFSECNSLSSVDLSFLNTEKLIDISSIFSKCSNLISVKMPLNKINSTISGSGYGMFDSCGNLEEIQWINFNYKSNNYSYTDFIGCNKLSIVNGYFEGINYNINLRNSPLTNASAMVFLNGLSEVEETKTITFKGSTFDTLSEEQIALATNKGWSVIRN